MSFNVVLVQVFQEADTITELGIQEIYWGQIAWGEKGEAAGEGWESCQITM